MTTEIIRYRIKAQNAGAFEEAYQKAEANLRNSKHCLGYRLLRGHEEPENWIVMIEMGFGGRTRAGLSQGARLPRVLRARKTVFSMRSRK
jgi:hypothetical protein